MTDDCKFINLKENKFSKDEILFWFCGIYQYTSYLQNCALFVC